ncbi:NUDIX domain-containing protein [Chloroflexota bacterium]
MAEYIIGRAQCIVHRDNKILIVKHRHENDEWWCLPGGAIEEGETPAEAAVRELKEECNVDGKIVRETGVVVYSSVDKAYTFEIDIGNQEPVMGTDPDYPQDKQVLVDVKWLALAEISERDRAYLWAAGLLGIGGFLKEVAGWGDKISYPES